MSTDEVLSRLDTLIKIQALSAVAHLQKKKDKVLFLSEAGLTPKEISVIVGISSASVSQTIYAEKKSKKDGEK